MKSVSDELVAFVGLLRLGNALRFFLICRLIEGSSFTMYVYELPFLDTTATFFLTTLLL